MRRAAATLVLALVGVAALWLLWPEDAEEALRAAQRPVAPVAPVGEFESADDADDDVAASPGRGGGPGEDRGKVPTGSRSPSAPTPVHEGKSLRAPLPKTVDGKVDFEAMGLTGKEVGADLLRSEETRREAAVDFRWREGDAWTVESYYRQMQSGAGDVWSGPTFWRFRVDGDAVCQGVPCQVLVVTMLDGEGAPVQDFPPCTYYVSAEGQRLVAADVYHVSGGKGKFSRVAGGDGALGVVGSIVPFDLPAAGTRGVLVGSGGLETPLAPMTARSRRSLPQAGELLGAGDDYVEVAYAAPGDGSRVTQRWATRDSRWPASSITHHRRSYRRR